MPPPPSTSSFLINLTGGLGFIAIIKILGFLYPDMDAFQLSIISTFATVILLIILEAVFLKTYLRPSAGMKREKSVDAKRVQTKLLGYTGTLAIVLIIYSFFPLYTDDDFYDVAFLYLLLLLPAYILIGWIYIAEVDCRMMDPRDGLWQAGNTLRGNWRETDRKVLFSYCKSVMLRVFFLPVMLGYMTGNVQHVIDGNNDFADTLLQHLSHSPSLAIMQFFLIIYFFLACIDTLFAITGYLMTFRPLDSHIRSTEPTLLGWVVCIMCYYPFWEILFATFLFEKFYSNPEWYIWFNEYPVLLAIWGPLVIIGMGLEALTTLTFGIRFSNLTYRGLITTGTFRLSKHPQYIFKMLNRFCCFVPFLSLDGYIGVVQNTGIFAMICFVYYLRAKTEETHLSRYPEYVEYAKWMNQNGIFRWVGKVFPAFIYSEEKAKAGKLF